MKTIVIIATLLLTTTFASLKLTLKRIVKFKIKTNSKQIDEDFSLEPAKPNFSVDKKHKIVLPREKVKMIMA